jgi:hypothetical protein|tara:strand:+ start:3909 stop:4058 length:150 start_codon:yes stop_codon:yes gene_type:complete
MINIKNIETDEEKTISITEFMEWFNNDSSGYLSSVWRIEWVQYEHPHTK